MPTSVAHEAHHRAARARAALTDLPASTLQALTTHQRLTVLTALTTTHLLFAAETWFVPTYRQVKTMDRALHDTYAKALGLTFRHHHIDDRQLRAAHAPKAPPLLLFLAPGAPPASSPRPQTLCSNSFLPPLSHHSPTTQWEEEVRRDFLWLTDAIWAPSSTSSAPSSTDHPDPGHLEAWLDFAANYPKPWARFITPAAEQACQQDAQGVPPIPTGAYMPPSPPAATGSHPPSTCPDEPDMSVHAAPTTITLTTPPYVTPRPEGTATCAYKYRCCSYHADTKRAVALLVSTAHSWRAAP